MSSHQIESIEIITSQLNEILITGSNVDKHPINGIISDDDVPCTPSKSSVGSDERNINTPSHSTLSSDSMIFSTPQSDRNVCCTDATCSVCLSPLLCRTTLVETRCKHVFHEKCLKEAKSRKAECPNCRASLTPLPLPPNDVPPSIDYSGGYRDAIIARSAAARNAVRMATARREHERQRAAIEMRESNKENM